MTKDEVYAIIDELIAQKQSTADIFRGSVHERLKLITYNNDLRVEALTELRRHIENA